MKGLFILIFLILSLTIGALLFDYSFCFWAGLIKGTPVQIPFYLAMLGGILLNGFNIPIAIITLIASHVI